MKETAVEWLIKQIKEDQTIKAKSMGEWNTVFHQSKEMEKEQIIEAVESVSINEKTGEFLNGKEYYNEVFIKN
jgi:hypothetical protein